MLRPRMFTSPTPDCCPTNINGRTRTGVMVCLEKSPAKLNSILRMEEVFERLGGEQRHVRQAFENDRAGEREHYSAVW